MSYRSAGRCLLALGLGLAAGCTAVPLTGPILGGPAATTGTGAFSDRLPVRPSVGFLFERYRAPLQTNVKDLTIGPKTGTAAIFHVRDPIFTNLPLVTLGNQTRDMAAAAAAQQGNISEIDLIEIERFSVLGIYVRETVIVHGN